MPLSLGIQFADRLQAVSWPLPLDDCSIAFTVLSPASKDPSGYLKILEHSMTRHQTGQTLRMSTCNSTLGPPRCLLSEESCRFCGRNSQICSDFIQIWTNVYKVSKLITSLPPTHTRFHRENAIFLIGEAYRYFICTDEASQPTANSSIYNLHFSLMGSQMA